jgi:hypothetical protein
MPTAPARPMPMKAVGMAAPASETLLELEPELEPEPEPEPELLDELEPEADLVVVEPERLELRSALEELELPAEVLLPPMKVPLGATDTGTVPLAPPPMRVPVPRTPGAVVMGELEVALATALLALLTSDEAAEVREERPARSVGTR